MKNSPNPNPIKDYYIAYFDILGYRQFFKDNPEKVEDLLNEIHSAALNTKDTLTVPNNVDFFDLIGVNVDFKVKIFSDNIIVCLKRDKKNYLECPEDNRNERLRAIMFLDRISTIQRNFIVKHKLFLRGGVTIGKISFNDDYVFGEGLIEVVDIEEHTVYPRIEISNSFFNFVSKPISYSDEEFNKAIEIEKDIKNNVEVSQENKLFYEHISQLYQPELYIQQLLYNCVYFYGDGKTSLSYLYNMNINDYFSNEALLEVNNKLKQFFPNTYNELNSMKSTSLGINDIFKIHRECVVEKINTYGNYNDIEFDKPADAIQREHVLKKYAWSMKYHNDMCVKYNKKEYFIDSIANCDARFMLLMMNVVELQQNIDEKTPSEQKNMNNNEQWNPKLEED